MAHHRFVLGGEAPFYYGVVAALLLAALNYAFFRFTNPGRLTAYLTALSLGVAALLLPQLLSLSEEWTSASLFTLVALILLATIRVEPDGTALLDRLRRREHSLLVESHLAVGTLLLFVGVVGLSNISNDSINAVTLLLLTGILLGLAFYLRASVPLGVASLTGGFALMAALRAGLVEPETLALPVGVVLYALLSAALAPLFAKRLPYANGILTIAALFWALYARLTWDTTSMPGWVQALVIAAYVGASFLLLYRYRNPLAWLWGWGALNFGVMDGLLHLPSESSSVLLPSLAFLGVAAFWLLAESVLRTTRFRLWALLSFAVQAFLLTAGFYLLRGLAPEIEDGTSAAVITLFALTWGWLWLIARHERAPLVLATVAQGALALPFFLLAFAAPDVLLPIAWLVVALGLLLIAPRLPDFAKRPAESAALLLALIAPLGIPLTDYLNLAGTSDTLQTQVSQATLFGAAGVYALFGFWKRRRWAIGVAGGLTYALYVWLLFERGIDDIQLYSAPLAFLLFSYRWLFPKEQALWENLGAFVLIGVGIFEALAEENWIYSALLGAWGILLLGTGISLSRRGLIVAGVTGILFAAVRQLWEVVVLLPPAMIIALVGLTFLLTAIGLLLTRDRWLKRPEETGS